VKFSLGKAQPPQRRDFCRPCGVQRVAAILCLRVLRSGIQPAEHLQAGAGDPAQEFVARTQFEVFGDIGNDQPAFAARCQVRGQSAEKAAQHARIGVVDRVFDGRTRLRRQPGRIADNQRGTAGREQIGFDDLHFCGQPEFFDIFRRAGQRPRRHVGADYRQATPGKYSGKNAGTGTDVESLRGIGDGSAAGRQRRLGDQINVFPAHRREHAVMRMDAPLHGGHWHAFLAPFVGADHRQQFTQRDDAIAAIRLAPGFAAGRANILGTA
jgi:hypothetical protein